jgi:hypothetical protein
MELSIFGEYGKKIYSGWLQKKKNHHLIRLMKSSALGEAPLYKTPDD